MADEYAHFKSRMRAILGDLSYEIGIIKGGILHHSKSPTDKFTAQDVFTFSISRAETASELTKLYQKAYPKTNAVEILRDNVPLMPEKSFDGWAIENVLYLRARSKHYDLSKSSEGLANQDNTGSITDQATSRPQGVATFQTTKEVDEDSSRKEFLLQLPPETLQQNVRAISNVLDALKDVLSKNTNPETSQQWIVEIGEAQELCQRPRTIIGVVGVTGSGKSSLSNALVDEEQLIPSSCLRACTAVVTEISYNEDPLHPYKAEVEFITREEWREELQTLFGDIGDERANIESELRSQSQEAGIALAKMKAVYPHLGKRDILITNADDLAAHPDIAEYLGTTICLDSQTSRDIHLQVSRYIDSKEKIELSQNQLQSATQLQIEVWPLVRAVRMYVRAEVLSTGSVLVDLPGIQDANQARAAVAESYMKKCSKIWVVAPIIRAVDEKAAHNLLGDSFKRQLKLDGNLDSITFICSKSDDCKVAEVVKSLSLSHTFEGLDARIAANAQEMTAIDSEVDAVRQKLDEIRFNQQVLKKQRDWYDMHRDEIRKGALVYPPIFKQSSNMSYVSPKRPLKKQRQISEYLEPSDEHNLHHVDVQQDSGAEPLTKESLKACIQELKQAKKGLNEEIRALSEKFKDLSQTARILEFENESVRQQKWQMCVLKRNKYCRAEIKRQFANGIRDLDQEIAEAENPDAIDPDINMRDYANIAKSLPVFCVSASGYHKLSGRLTEEHFSHSFANVSQTEIPQLKAHCQKIGQISQVRSVLRSLDRVNQITTEIRLWLSSDDLPFDLLKQNRDAEKQALNEKLEALIQDITDSIRAMMANFTTLVDESIFNVSSVAIRKAKEEALPTSSQWNRNTREGGLKWNTYKAVTRRNGAFGKHDFNKQLLKPLLQHLTPGWTQIFEEIMPTMVAKTFQTCRELMSKFGVEAELHFRTTGMAGDNIKRLKNLSSIFGKSLDNHFTDAENSLHEDAKHANREFEEAIRSGMQTTYLSCAAESGTGMLQRMRATMEGGLSQHKEMMFEQSAQDVQTLLKDSIRDAETILIDSVKNDAAKLSRGYQHAFQKTKGKLSKEGKNESNVKKILLDSIDQVDFVLDNLFSAGGPTEPTSTSPERLMAAECSKTSTKVKKEQEDTNQFSGASRSVQLPLRSTPTPVPEAGRSSLNKSYSFGSTGLRMHRCLETPRGLKRAADLMLDDDDAVDDSSSESSDCEDPEPEA